MIKFRCNGKLYAVNVADLRKELTRITADLWRGDAVTQAYENN
ncbi:MAG: hypothetical protein U5L00_11300 [Desulfovermiculus sp.]|nr:hypothetical protein [Desulfovermiculus sp.]